MKKQFVMIFVAVVAMTAVFAAGTAESTVAEGKIAIVDSVPVIAGAGKNWVLPPGAFYQVAWENGIKAGDTVKAEGFVRECPADFPVKNATMLMPTRVWVNGKELDLSKVRHPMMRDDRDGRGGFGRGNGMGRGGRGCGGFGGRGCGPDSDDSDEKR